MIVRLMSIWTVGTFPTSCSAKSLSADQLASLAECVIDVDEALVYLGYAGLAIEAVHVNCAKSAPIADCSSIISAIIGSFSWGAVYLLAIASSCSMRDIVPAQIAGAWTDIVASLADISFGASSITQDCDPIADDYSRIGFAENRAVEKAACAFDADLGATNLARAGLVIRDAAKDCPDREAKKECAVSLGTVFASITWVAQFLSYTATDCPKYINPGAACAGDIAAIVGGAAQIATSSVALSILLPPMPPTQNLAPFIPVARRLEEKKVAGASLSYASSHPSGRILYRGSRMPARESMDVSSGFRPIMLNMSAHDVSSETRSQVTPQIAGPFKRKHDKAALVEHMMAHPDTVFV